jgi:Gp157 protein
MPEAGSGSAVSSSEAIVEASRAFMAAARRTNTLYELSEDFLRVLDLLEDPDSDEAALEVELDQISGLIAHKAEAIAGLVAHIEGLADARRAEAKRLKDRADADERHAQRLRDYVLRHMQAIGTQRIETLRFTLQVRTNPPAVEVLEDLLIPEEFWRVPAPPPPAVDKRAILDHYKQTGEIPQGVEIVRRTRLDIR